MKKKLANKKTMMIVTAKYLETHSNIWNNVPLLVTYLAEFNRNLEQINAFEEKQAESKVNLGTSKLEIKMKAATLGGELDNVLEVLASVENDTELAQRMKTNKWEIYKLPQDVFKLKIKAIIEAATQYKELLCTQYGVEECKITTLNKLLTEFIAIENKPRQLRIQVGIATEELNILFKENMDKLRYKIDKLMKIFETDEPEFYMGYVRSRIIID